MVRSDLRSASRDRPKERAKASILAALRVAAGKAGAIAACASLAPAAGREGTAAQRHFDPSTGALVAQRIEQLPPK